MYFGKNFLLLSVLSFGFSSGADELGIGSWDEVRKKTQAVTVYEEIRNVPVCCGIIDGKKVFRTYRLREEARKIKRGELRPGNILQLPPFMRKVMDF